MSDRPKGLPKPDGPGRWMVMRLAAERFYRIEQCPDGTLITIAGHPLDEIVREFDQWYRCYVPGLDDFKPTEEEYPLQALTNAWVSLQRAKVFSDGRTYEDIDTLAAQRDEARQEIARLREELQGRVQSSETKEAPDQPGRWWVTRSSGVQHGYLVKSGGVNYVEQGDKWQNIDALEAERDAARQEVERLKEEVTAECASRCGTKCYASRMKRERDYWRDRALKAESDFHRSVDQLSDLDASLRRAKGDTDADEGCFTLPWLINRFIDVVDQKGTEDAERLMAVFEGVYMHAKRRKLEEEASRAT